VAHSRSVYIGQAQLTARRVLVAFKPADIRYFIFRFFFFSFLAPWKLRAGAHLCCGMWHLVLGAPSGTCGSALLSAVNSQRCALQLQPPPRQAAPAPAPSCFPVPSSQVVQMTQWIVDPDAVCSSTPQYPVSVRVSGSGMPSVCHLAPTYLQRPTRHQPAAVAAQAVCGLRATCHISDMA
jgi:hypothetical protein